MGEGERRADQWEKIRQEKGWLVWLVEGVVERVVAGFEGVKMTWDSSQRVAHGFTG